MDKSLFFLFITFLCIWLILDEFVGNGYIGNLVDNLIGGGSSTSSTSIIEKAKKAAEKAAESKASGKSKTAEASKNHKERR